MSALDPNDARAVAGSLAVALRRQLAVGNDTIDLAAARRLAIALRTLTRGATDAQPNASRGQANAAGGPATANGPYAPQGPDSRQGNAPRPDFRQAPRSAPAASASAPAADPAAPSEQAASNDSRRSLANATSAPSAPRPAARRPRPRSTVPDGQRPPWAQVAVRDNGVGSDALREIRERLGECDRCALNARRTSIVFGAGNPEARLMFVGDMPGAEEDRRGEPFLGPAGELLNKMIAAMGLSRQAVYLTTAVKCRPPANRAAAAAEVAACAPFLKEQIEAVAPEAIVALGSRASSALLGRPVDIGAERGSWTTYNGTPLLLTVHPGYLLRNPAAKREAWADLQSVMAKLNLSR